MDADGTLSCLMEEADGSYSAAYGPFVLKSAFQPIFSQSSGGKLSVDGYEALVRPFKGTEMATPSQFFSMVESGDGPAVERLCRRLHLANIAGCDLGSALVFLNFDPGCFTAYGELVREADNIAVLVREAGLSPTQVVCEIIEKQTSAPNLLRSLSEALREHRFKIAIDDYGAEDSDFDRVALLRPDIVKFDAIWVRRFMETSEGFALLRAMVRRFRESGVLTLFEGLEEHWQVATCRDLGVRLLQGYALARPKLAPILAGTPEGETGAGDAFIPAERLDGPASPIDAGKAAPIVLARAPQQVIAGRRAVFGRRGR